MQISLSLQDVLIKNCREILIIDKKENLASLKSRICNYLQGKVTDLYIRKDTDDGFCYVIQSSYLRRKVGFSNKKFSEKGKEFVILDVDFDGEYFQVQIIKER